MTWRTCPLCGEGHNILLADEELDAYFDYEDGKGLIQDLFPTFNPMEREFLKTGYCPHCQQMLFGSEYESERIR